MTPTTQKAAVLAAVASELVLEERAVPTPGPGQVLIHNRVVGVNPIDWKRQAWGFLVRSFPAVLGADVSGTVVSVGPSVDSLKAGDRVFASSHGLITGNNDNAAYQEYTVALASATAKLPAKVDLHAAATLPTAVGTAALALFGCFGFPRPSGNEAGGSGSGPDSGTVLIWGAASSVGTMAVQLASLAGLTVIATARARHHDRLKKLGANVVVDYSSPTVAADLLTAAAAVTGSQDGIANIFDCISTPETLGKCFEVAALSSASAGRNMQRRLVHTAPWPSKDLVPPPNLDTEQVNGTDLWTAKAQDLSQWLFGEMLPAWLEGGKMAPLKHRTVEGGLESGLQKALTELKAGGVSGERLVVEIPQVF